MSQIMKKLSTTFTASLCVALLVGCGLSSQAGSSKTNELLESKSELPEKIEMLARKACKEAFEPQGRVPKMLHSEANTQNGHWQVQLINGSWQKARPSAKMQITQPGDVTESCIVVIDGVMSDVISMRDS
jgi:hypothetical protein